ncbi:MAG: nucleotidyl transferase AbiEii/AbiGii toxin family protein [Raoultibacter sp.]
MTAVSIDKLKARIRNRSKGDSTRAQILMRHYGAERFLERLALSTYRDNFVLKGGTLIAAKVGLENRSTLDIDTTLKGVTLSEAEVIKLVEAVCAIDLEDGMTFRVNSVRSIMHESDYPGIRVLMEASLEKVRIPMKIDLSTDDVITPHEILFPMPLMFEDKTVALLAYNTETALAEKLETIIARGNVNTRMRDFYDIYMLDVIEGESINYQILKDAFANTSRKRSTDVSDKTVRQVLKEVKESPELLRLWNKYQQEFHYAEAIEWDMVLSAAEQMLNRITDK